MSAVGRQQTASRQPNSTRSLPAPTPAHAAAPKVVLADDQKIVRDGLALASRQLPGIELVAGAQNGAWPWPASTAWMWASTAWM